MNGEAQAQIESLLSACQEAFEGGREVSPGELCRDCPELLPRLEEHLSVLRRMGALEGPGASERTGPFDRVEAACKDFSGEWAAGARPDVSSYLEKAGRDSRTALLRNLLHCEVAERRGRGEAPGAEEYAARFPQDAALVREVFLESSSASRSHQGDSTANPDGGPRAPAASRLGGYQLLRELGRGGMGVVFEAVHVRRGHRVALKTLPVLGGEALHRFKREFRALADVSHPNLIGLHGMESDGGQWFFTMDLLDGANFLAHVRPGGRMDEGRLRAALAQLVAGVMALHARRMVHRDLKPQNVMVAGGRVVVLDFGLVAELERAGAAGSAAKVAGTPAYMAPEQAAGERVGPAADWYAVGVMLYEALCGRLPFVGSLWQVLSAKQSHDPPPPAAPAALGDLKDLCMRLLRRDPRLRPDALAVVGAVSPGAAAGAAGPQAAPLAGQRLVGREQHLAALGEARSTLERLREPVTAFLRGRSGEGKSALAEHFLAPLRKDGRLAVMSGRCYDRESVPFKALDTLIDALGSYLRPLPEAEAALLMPDDIGILARVFPVLQRVEVVARASDARLSALDEQQVRRRAFAALRSLLARIGRRSPVVWFIDDLQWGDADSAEALFEVLRPPEAPPLLFLGAYRSDETEGSPFLKAWKERQLKHDVTFADREVNLAPLSVEECTELVVGLLGKDTENIRRRAAEFAQETRGNPFLLIELVGCFDPESDSFERLPLHEVIDRKLGQLPPEAGPLLEAVAVSGQALSPEEASRTVGHELPPLSTLIHMRNERLVRLTGSEDRLLIDTYHDRVREAVLGHLDGGRRKTLHRTLAEVIEVEAGAVSIEQVAPLEQALEQGGGMEVKANPRVYDLAYHFDAAGEKAKARTYALLAAEQSRRQSALEVAANNYAIARRNGDDTAGAVRYRIAEGYAEVLLLLGRYEEASAQLDGTIDLVTEPDRKARIELLLGDISQKQGLLDKGCAWYEKGIRRLGHWIPGCRFGLGYGLLRETLVQAWHCLRPGRLHRQPPSDRVDLTVHLFNRLTNAYVFQSTPKTLWAQLVALNRCELGPPSPRLAEQIGHHGLFVSMVGWHTRGKRFSERANLLAGQFDDLLVHGHCFAYSGIADVATGRYEEALPHLKGAVAAFDKVGDQWALNLAHFHLGYCHYGLGNLVEAVSEARLTFTSSVRLGDSRSLCSSYLWARATGGNFPFDDLRSCLPNRPDDVMSTVHGLMAEGYWHSYQGRTEEAVGVFEQAAEMVRRSFCLNFHTVAVMPALAGALRRHADVVSRENTVRGDQIRRRAFYLAKWAVRVTRFFPTAYSQSLRELSLILEVKGNREKALKYADKSCAVAEKQKAKYEHAQSLLVRGRLAKELGLPEGDDQIKTAEAALEASEKAVLAVRP